MPLVLLGSLSRWVRVVRLGLRSRFDQFPVPWASRIPEVPSVARLQNGFVSGWATAAREREPSVPFLSAFLAPGPVRPDEIARACAACPMRC